MYVKAAIAWIGLISVLFANAATAETGEQFTYLLRSGCDGSASGVNGNSLAVKYPLNDEVVSSRYLIASPEMQAEACTKVLENAYSALTTFWVQKIVISPISYASVKCSTELSVATNQSGGNVTILQNGVTISCSGTKVFEAGLAGNAPR